MEDDIILFLKAQHEAEEREESYFICPICGGNAKWHRSDYNCHLHCSCGKCGILIME